VRHIRRFLQIIAVTIYPAAVQKALTIKRRRRQLLDEQLAAI